MTAAHESYDLIEGDQEHYEEEEEEEEEEDNDEQAIAVAEEIVLSHEEVWDDSALIEAWDAAVKQYELYHQSPSGESLKSGPATKETRINTPSKRTPSAAPTRSGSAAGMNKRSWVTNDSKPTSLAKTNTATGTSFSTTTSRKDTTKKHQLSSNSQGSTTKESTGGPVPRRKKAKTEHAQPSESAAPTWSWPQASHETATADSSYNPYASQAPPYPYMMPSYTGMSGMPPPPPMMPWGMPPGPPMFAPPPPPSSMFTPPFLSSNGGVAHGMATGPRNMDDESLGNLIMAWYYSGYYTGLYQARRQQ